MQEGESTHPPSLSFPTLREFMQLIFIRSAFLYHVARSRMPSLTLAKRFIYRLMSSGLRLANRVRET